MDIFNVDDEVCGFSACRTPSAIFLKKEQEEQLSFNEFESRYVQPVIERYGVALVRPLDRAPIPEVNLSFPVVPKLQVISMNESGAAGIVKVWDCRKTTFNKFLLDSKKIPNLEGEFPEKQFFSQKSIESQYVNDIDCLPLLVKNKLLSGDMGLGTFGEWSGITTWWTYGGRSNTVAAYHTEDEDVASTNIHILGAPKIWYVIAYNHAEKFHNLIKEELPLEFEKCEVFHRHKMAIFNPSNVVKDFGIEVTRIVQRPGDIVFTGPGDIHQIVNTGANWTQARNYLPTGNRSKLIISNAKHCSFECSFQDKSVTLPLEKVGDNSLYKCMNIECDYTADSPQGIKYHMGRCKYGVQDISTTDVPGVVCPFCPEGKVIKRIGPHIKSVHPNKDLQIACLLCGEKTENRKKHFKNCKKCRYCQVIFEKFKDANAHICAVKHNLKCRLCGLETGDLWKHTIRCKKCCECGAYFKDYKVAKIHQCLHDN